MRSLDAYQDQPVYVVLGVQGSGTHLLSRFLTRVFGCSVLHDHAYVFEAARRLGTRPSPRQVAREIAALAAHLRPSRLRSLRMVRGIRDVAPFAGIEHALRPSDVRSGADFARLVYAYRAAAVGAQHLAIKSDDIWEGLADIDDVLPNRRVLLLTRDFRDNVVSIMHKPFGPVDPLCAARYVKARFAAYEAEHARAGAHGCVVRFETLVERSDLCVHEMASRFGLTPVDDWDRVRQSIPTKPGRIGRWRTLSPRDQAQCEALLCDELERHGYPLAFGAAATPPSPLEGLAARARDFVGRSRQKAAVLAGKVGQRW
ncbi:MAG: sulfotransferase [Vicinamibacterales bacterium]